METAMENELTPHSKNQEIHSREIDMQIWKPTLQTRSTLMDTKFKMMTFSRVYRKCVWKKLGLHALAANKGSVQLTVCPHTKLEFCSNNQVNQTRRSLRPDYLTLVVVFSLCSAVIVDEGTKLGAYTERPPWTAMTQLPDEELGGGASPVEAPDSLDTDTDNTPETLQRVCKNQCCGKRFTDEENTSLACHYHRGPISFSDRSTEEHKVRYGSFSSRFMIATL